MKIAHESIAAICSYIAKSCFKQSGAAADENPHSLEHNFDILRFEFTFSSMILSKYLMCFVAGCMILFKMEICKCSYTVCYYVFIIRTAYCTYNSNAYEYFVLYMVVLHWTYVWLTNKIPPFKILNFQRGLEFCTNILSDTNLWLYTYGIMGGGTIYVQNVVHVPKK